MNTSELQINKKLSRILTQVSPKVGSVYKNLKKKRIKSPKFPTKNKSDLPFGCEKSDLNKDLSNEETFNLFMKSDGFKDKKEIYISFYYYNKFLCKVYKIMMNKLKNKFDKLALKHNISKEAQRNYWKICEKDLNNYLDKMNDKSDERILSYMDGCCIKSKLRFQLFIISYRIFWDKNMKYIKHKCTTKFNNQLKNFN